MSNLYPKMQSAYRRHHSTETALLRLHDDLLRAVDNGSEAVLILLDFSAAFDTIDHGILLRRLEERLGFSGLVLAWIRSYFDDRHQFICVKDSTSPTYDIDCGVPQGSVLGPIFFCLYVAPLEDILAAHGLSAMTYADDTQLYIIIEKGGHDIAVHVLQNCLN